MKTYLYKHNISYDLMKKRGHTILIVIILVLVIIAAFSFISLSQSPTTGNSILDRVRALLDGGRANDVQQMSAKSAKTGASGSASASLPLDLKLLGNKLVLENIDVLPDLSVSTNEDGTSSVSGEPIYLLEKSCDSGIVIAEDELKGSTAVFDLNSTVLEDNERYCILIPGIYSDEYKFRYEFYNTYDFRLSTYNIGNNCLKCPDVNGNSRVDTEDVLLVRNSFGSSGSDHDMNYDDKVDIKDVTCVSSNSGKSAAKIQACITTNRSQNVLCDPSPLSNENYVCASSEGECEFFGAAIFGSNATCNTYARQLSQKRYLCRPNKFLDYKCYNQFDDCISGVEEVFEGASADSKCKVKIAPKNSKLWYLCYCVPESLKPKPGSTLKEGMELTMPNNLALQRFIYENADELELKRGYPCTQEPSECLSCPISVELYGKAVGETYCDPSEKESVVPQFPRGVVSVHESQESCLEETEFYECR